MTALRSLAARPDDAITTRWLRGAELATHVAARLDTHATAAQIAQGAGYSVGRCAQRLAEAGHAPLARILLARDWTDRKAAQDEARIEARIDGEWAAFKAKAAAEPRRTSRPPLTADELLDELTDMAECGLSFAQASERLEVLPYSLRARARRAGLSDQVSNLFPPRRRVNQLRSASLADELLALAEAGESWQASARRMGYSHPKSLAKRLHQSGDLRRVQAAFGVRIWSAA